MTPAHATQAVNTAARPVPAVRPAKKADAAMLADLHARCMGAAFDGVCREFSRMVSAPAQARAFIDAALNDENASVMILRMGNRAVGYAVARRSDGPAPARLEAIGVIESERRNGYGRILMRNVARALDGLQIDTPVAHGFFASVGQALQGAQKAGLVSVGSQGLMVSGSRMGRFSLAVR